MRKVILLIMTLLCSFCLFNTLISQTNKDSEYLRSKSDNLVKCLFFNQCTKPSMEQENFDKIQGIIKKEIKVYDDFDFLMAKSKFYNVSAIYYTQGKKFSSVYYEYERKKKKGVMRVDVDIDAEPWYQIVNLKFLDLKDFSPKHKNRFATPSKVVAFEVAKPVKRKTYGLKVEMNNNNSERKQGTVKLRWNCSKNKKYCVYYSDTKDRGYAKLNKELIDKCYYTVRNLISGKKYYFVITEVTDDIVPIESKFSAVVAGTAN